MTKNTAVLLLGFLAAIAPAAQAWSPGDKVKVRWGGAIRDAVVVGVQPRSGWIQVRFAVPGGQTITPVLTPDKVFADGASAAAADAAEDRRKADLLAGNSDGKNVSSQEFVAWHKPGKAGVKLGPVIGRYRVAAYRAGSEHVILESPGGARVTMLICDLANADRSYLFSLLKRDAKRP